MSKIFRTVFVIFTKLRFLPKYLEYVNGVFQTGFLYFGFRGVGKGGLERGWGGVGEGLGDGLGRGLGRALGGLGFLYFKNPV